MVRVVSLGILPGPVDDAQENVVVGDETGVDLLSVCCAGFMPDAFFLFRPARGEADQ